MAKITLVLLPGMDGSGRLFDAFVAELANDFNIVIVRYPASVPLSYAELEAVARQMIPPHGPYVLLAESFSGPIAIALAASADARLKGLVLCCTFARNPRPSLTKFRPLLDALPMGWLPALACSYLLHGSAATTALRAALAQALAPITPAVLRERLKAVLTVDVTAELAAVKVPVLYLRAARDKLVPPSACALILTIQPQTQVVEFDASHALLQVLPARTGAAVRNFCLTSNVLATDSALLA